MSGWNTLTTVMFNSDGTEMTAAQFEAKHGTLRK
jgi:hypothetical protein